MGKIKLRDNVGGNQIKKTPKINFTGFNEEQVKREDQVSSILLPLKDIEPFEHNVRIDYEKEPMERLKQSIKENGNIGNIDVFHIIKGEKYIISDGHRTHKAYMEIYGPEYKVEVVVRKKYPEYNKQVELELMKVGFITSNTKENLGIHEELESIFKYLSKLDSVEPDKSPHKISQKSIYEALGVQKGKAMKLNNIIQATPRELFPKFKELDVSFRSMLELSTFENKEDFNNVVEMIKDGKIESSEEIKKYKNIIEYENINNNISTENENKEDNKKEIVAKFDEFKKDKQGKKIGKLSNDEKMVKDIQNSVNKIHKALMNINVENLTQDLKRKLSNSISDLTDILKKKKLK